MKVLIVDDEVEICKHLQRELKKEGYEVEYTTSPVDVIERLYDAKREEKPYELLLLDLRMPEVDGFELLRHIRKAQLDLDVITITAYGDEDKAVEAVRLGAVDYLRKPISLEELHTAIFRVQQKRAREAEKALRHRILVVDDEKDMCARIKRELDKEGYQAVVAYDGVEGLDYFKNNRVDAVVADIRMPGMSGLEMLRRCREITDDCVFIIITGYGDHETAIEALRLGVFDYLRKPIMLEEVVGSVDRGIGLLLLGRGLSASRRELEIETIIKEQYAKSLEKMVEERTKELREKERFSSNIIATIPESLLVLDKDLRIENANRSFYEVFQTEPERAIGSSIVDILRDKDGKLSTELTKLFGTEDMLEDFELHHQSEKLGERVFNISAREIIAAEEELVVIKDVTERKRAMEALRKLSNAVHQSADSVIITNKDSVIEYVNPAFEKLTCYTREEASGKTPDILKSGKHDKKFYKRLYETIHSGMVYRGEIINKKKNGEIYLVEAAITPITDTQGNITHFVSTEKDITEHKKAEEIRLENERLTHASQAKSEFLAIMSHELRTPLNAIIGFSELLKQKKAGELNENQARYVDNVLTGGKHLLNLINDILDLSKVEAGKMELAIEKMSMPAVIYETLALIKEKAAKHNVIIKKEIDPQLEIEADKQRFKQILFNLLDNAVKFSKKEGGIVTITAEKEGNMAKISVSDTGIGIKEEDMGKLFNKFQQIDSSISRRYGGTGLGLAVIKRLVEMHGGKIMAESKYGEGSTFTFLLPLIAGGED